MLGVLNSGDDARRDQRAEDSHASAEKIDVTRYLDEMERSLRASTDVRMRNEVLAILRRWQIDTMLTDYSCERAARLLREFTDIGPLQRVWP